MPALIARTTRTDIARKAALAATVAAGTVLMVGAPANAESFHYSSMNTSFTPWASPNSRGTQSWTVQARTTVRMRCWTTGAYRNGTGKWFYIVSQAYPFTEGYVPATTVSNQWLSSPHC